MKKFIQTIAFFSLCTFLFIQQSNAQAEWRSNTGATVNNETTDIKRTGEVGIGINADNARKLNILATGKSFGIFSDAGANASGWVRAVHGTITSGSGYAIGLSGSSYNSNATNGGRSYGVYATAGNASNGYNYGVFSRLLGARNGAALVGWDAKNNPSWNQKIDDNHDFAGYLVGDLKLVDDNSAFFSFGRTNGARLEMAVASCNTCFSPRANTNDLVLRKMGLGGKVIFDTGSDFAEGGEDFLFTAGGQTLMLIKDNGKVGVGTDNTPTSIGGDNISAYTLFVKGGLLSDEVRVETGWADYVFEEDYDLKSLEEVEDYIEENGHLPNVPSAEEVEAQGVELGEMTTIQQEKIEEIFLHLIEMRKEIETLKAENTLLKTHASQK